MSETNGLEAAAFYCDNCVFATQTISGEQEGCDIGYLDKFRAQTDITLAPAPSNSSRLVTRIAGRLGCPGFRTESWLQTEVIDKIPDALDMLSEYLNEEITIKSRERVREENRLKADVIIWVKNAAKVEDSIVLAESINRGAIKPARYIFVTDNASVDLDRIHKYFLANPIGSEILCSLALDPKISLVDLGVENVVSPWAWVIHDLDVYDDLLMIVDHHINENLDRFVALDFNEHGQGTFFKTDIYRAIGGDYELAFLDKIEMLIEAQKTPHLLRNDYWALYWSYDAQSERV